MRKFESIHIDKASPEQLRHFAQAFLGMPVEGDDDAAVLAKVRAANEGDTIFALAEPEEADQTGAPPPKVEEDQGGGLVGSFGRDDPKVTLTIHAEEKDGVVSTRHVPIGVNGVVFLLKRGESITIPYRVYEALNNAERHVITHNDKGEVLEQRVKNTPFNIERLPTPDEVKAWHERTDNVLMA